MSGIQQGEAGFRFILESDFDAGGVASRYIRIRQPGKPTSMEKVAAALSNDEAGDFFYIVDTGDFDEKGVHKAQLKLDFGGGKVLKGRVEKFRVGESI